MAITIEGVEGFETKIKHRRQKPWPSRKRFLRLVQNKEDEDHHHQGGEEVKTRTKPRKKGTISNKRGF
jgi:hypothetical protein